MKTSLKLQEVAEVLAALDLKSSISEAIDVLKDKMVDLEELPLAVVYALPIADGSVLRRETQTFCPSQPFFAIRLGQYCLIYPQTGKSAGKRCWKNGAKIKMLRCGSCAFDASDSSQQEGRGGQHGS